MIYVVSGEDVVRYPTLMEQVHRLSYGAYADAANQAGACVADFEHGQLDHPDVVHQICVRDDKVVGYQCLVPLAMLNLGSNVFSELPEESPAADLYVLTHRYIATAGRSSSDDVERELTSGFVEWGLAFRLREIMICCDIVWILRALRLKFLVRLLRFKTGHAELQPVTALLAFNRSTLQALRECRKHSSPVLCFLDGTEEDASLAV